MIRSPHQRLFSLYPLFQQALAFSAGVVTSNVVAPKLPVPIGLCAAASVLALVMFTKKKLAAAGLTLLAGFFFAGTSLAVVEKLARPVDSVRQQIDGEFLDEEQQIIVTGILDEPPVFARDRVYLVLRVETLNIRGSDLKTSGVVSLLATFKTPTSEPEYRQLDLHYGTRIRAKTTLSRNDRYRNPGVSSLTEYLERKGYDATGVVRSANAITRLGDVAVFKPLGWLYAWREIIQREIDEHFSPETAGVLGAALLGNRYNLSKSTADRFREGGTFHVLVISGLHISFIGGLVFLLVQRLTRRRLLQLISSSLVVWSYSLAVGAGPSVMRAALMFTFVALGSAVFRTASSLNSLGGAALVLLIRSPKDLFDPSLQLTFLSVMAIVTIAWPLLQTCKAIGSWRPTRTTPYPPSCPRAFRSFCEGLYWSEIAWRDEIDRSPHAYRLFKTPAAAWLEKYHLQRLLRYIASAVVVSAGVQIILLPLLIVYFHRLSLSSLILNIFVSLLLGVLGLVALGALLLSQLSLTLATPFIHLAESVDWLMVHSVDPFSWVGLASARLPEYTGWIAAIYFVYYVPLIILLVRLSRWQPLTAPARSPPNILVWPSLVFQLVLSGIVLLHPFSAGRAAGNLVVDFLDVGQGDAALVTMPDGVTLLVDGGGRPSFVSRASSSGSGGTAEYGGREIRSIGEMVVAEYLWWRGLDSIDYVLATHADADHIDGLNDVIRNFSVRSALVGRIPGNSVEYSKFAETLRVIGTHVELVQAGDELRFGEVTATVLWPAAQSEPSAPSGNNDSVVLRLKFGQVSMLLTGDIEKEAEAQILATKASLHADVVKVPHHGSRTSSTESFVSAIKPRLAIVSVGQTSMFGHPHQEVVERWVRSGAEVLTTGNCGAISVRTDGKTVAVRKFVQ